MIRSFNDQDTRRFFEGAHIARFQAFAAQATRRLAVLGSVAVLDDLAMLRSNRLEVLGGKRAGQYSVRISAQWRICFRWADNGPHNVEIVDYR